jgi:soluble cytochrome b562
MEFFREDEERAVFTLLSNEIAYLKKTFEEHTGRMESALKRAEGVKESLTAKVAALEGQLREKEDALDRGESVLKEMQASILDSERRAREKERQLEVCDTELKELRFKMDGLVNQMIVTESHAREAEALALRKAQEANQAKESLTAKIIDLAGQVREKEELVEIRETELKNLKTEMQALMGRMTRIESILREALAFSDGQKEAEQTSSSNS